MAETTELEPGQLPRLRAQQRAFVAHYLQTWNASEAARRAGYRRAPGTIGHDLLNNPRISLFVDAQLRELEVSARENLVRVSKIARGAMPYFITDGRIDVESEQAKENYNLLKKLRRTSNTRYDKDGEPVITETIEIEVYDALTALTLLMKHHNLLSEPDENSKVVNQNLTVNNLQVIADQSGVDYGDLVKQLQSIIAEQSRVIDVDSAPVLGTGDNTSLVASSPGVAPSVITQRVIMDEDEEIIGTS